MIQITKSNKFNHIIAYSDLVDGEGILEMLQDISSKNGCKLIAIANSGNPINSKEKMYIFSR